ncbi:MAG: glycosyltransferase family 1 protein [Pseudomonadota bacterium]|nr:glycosyltransferase family 1 protein [Pseudomonadota bacterium]
MRLLIATDAWHPQVNGVVRTYERLREELAVLGCDSDILSPRDYRTMPCPTYPEIRLALASLDDIARRIDSLRPDFIHIATEGPLGLMARYYCRKHRRPFTTSYHTRFPEYLSARLPVPQSWGYAMQRRFHNASSGMMVATPSLARVLRRRGFRRLMQWGRGVDTALFTPDLRRRRSSDRPTFLYVGRIAVEKNIAAFLDLDLPGRKVVIGDGPQLGALKSAYPQVHFAGLLAGRALATAYANADVFVFPSLTDTFGNVLLEALASGVPVAAFPVTGPSDVIGAAPVGVLDTDLRKAALRALDVDRNACRAHARRFDWGVSARQFLDNVEKAERRDARALVRAEKKTRILVRVSESP